MSFLAALTDIGIVAVIRGAQREAAARRAITRLRELRASSAKG